MTRARTAAAGLAETGKLAQAFKDFMVAHKFIHEIVYLG